MSHTPKTLGFVVVAVVLVAAAFYSVPSAPPPAAFSDVGELFFPQFTDHTAASSLTVVEFKETGEKQFRVERKNELWQIPSHHGYPADAKDRMAKAAGIFIGLSKDAVLSDRADDHARFGVLHPTEGKGEPGERGMLVSFQDAGRNTLASLVIGKEVEGKESTRYARLPDKKRTYMVKLPAEISAEFADWIESDLLEVTSHEVEKLTFDNYSIDEARGARVDESRLDVGKVGGEWAMLGLAPDEEVDRDGLNEVTTTLDDLKIVGVRKKPEGLTAQLTKADGFSEISREAYFSLQRRGFYMTRDGTLFANEGDLIAKTQKGIVYTLRFGEILVGTGDDVTAGAANEGAGEAGQPQEGEGLTANRYLMVTVAFDPSLLDQPAAAALPEAHLAQRAAARSAIERINGGVQAFKAAQGQAPATLSELTTHEPPYIDELEKDPWGSDYVYLVEPEGGAYTVASYGEDQAAGGDGVNADIVSNALAAEDQLKRNSEAQKAFQEKVTEGEELASTLRARFAPWFYVIEDESFKKLRRSRDQVVKKKAATTQPGG